jgi:very-short-patch-repair endonuclease
VPSKKRSPSRSLLEIKFEKLWKRLFPDIVLETEVRVCRDRRFRFDFAHPASKVAVEIQGGLWLGKNGSHTGGKGVARDCEKMCIAIANGWTVFTLSGEMITPKYLCMIRNTIVSRI